MIRRYCFLIILLLVYFLVSCNKDPIGFNELERELSVPLTQTLYPIEQYCYGKNVPLGWADYLVLGKNNEYESRILLKFPIDTLTLDGITSLNLVLYPYKYNGINFDIYLITKISEWQENSVTWNRTYEGQSWLNPGGDYYPHLITNVDLTTDSCIISIGVNPALLDTLRNYANGFILIPTSNGLFATINSRHIGKAPKLIVEYGVTKKTFTAVQDAHIIKAINLTPDPYQDAWLGAGYPFRTMLKFDLDSIPDNTTIVFAELVLPVQSSFSLSDTFDIAVWKVLEPYFASFTSFADNRFAQSRFHAANDSIIKFDLRNIVQFWKTKPDSNFGILISCYPQNHEISRVQLRTNPVGPYLKVAYILPPERRFK